VGLSYTLIHIYYYNALTFNFVDTNWVVFSLDKELIKEWKNIIQNLYAVRTNKTVPCIHTHTHTHMYGTYRRIKNISHYLDFKNIEVYHMKRSKRDFWDYIRNSVNFQTYLIHVELTSEAYKERHISWFNFCWDFCTLQSIKCFLCPH
jgi:hypothetical protein